MARPHGREGGSHPHLAADRVVVIVPALHVFDERDLLDGLGDRPDVLHAVPGRRGASARVSRRQVSEGRRKRWATHDPCHVCRT